MNTLGLHGPLLDFWVAKSEGLKLMAEPPQPGDVHHPESGLWHPLTFHPSNDWSQGGRIVSRDWYDLEDQLIRWFGENWTLTKSVNEAPLVWFMRAYVATKFGDVVEDPEHLRSSDRLRDRERGFPWFGRRIANMV